MFSIVFCAYCLYNDISNFGHLFLHFQVHLWDVLQYLSNYFRKKRISDNRLKQLIYHQLTKFIFRILIGKCNCYLAKQASYVMKKKKCFQQVCDQLRHKTGLGFQVNTVSWPGSRGIELLRKRKNKMTEMTLVISCELCLLGLWQYKSGKSSDQKQSGHYQHRHSTVSVHQLPKNYITHNRCYSAHPCEETESRRP